MGSNIKHAPPLSALLSSIAPSRPELITSLLPSLLTAVSSIAAALRKSQTVSATSTTNTFGDAQLNVDVLAEDLLRAALARCRAVRTASSEEDPVEMAVSPPTSSRQTEVSLPVDHENGTATEETYTVAFDPLDGSSIIAPNWTVGTIIGIWDGASALNSPPREKQVAAVLGVYGPRTTALVAVRLPGQQGGVCIELGLSGVGVTVGADDEWEVVRERVLLSAEETTTTRYFAPANLRAAADDPKYMALVGRYIAQRYTLRYSGGLVPDVVHALVKGHGIYLSPLTAESKAKLRRLYELCPLALVVECARGKAIDPADGSDVLGRDVRSCDERGGLICGTSGEVDIAREALLR